MLSCTACRRGLKPPGLTQPCSSRASVADDVVYAAVKSLFSQFERFRRMHPAFSELDIKTMVNTPLAAPMHPGAARYFREAGLLE